MKVSKRKMPEGIVIVTASELNRVKEDSQFRMSPTAAFGEEERRQLGEERKTRMLQFDAERDSKNVFENEDSVKLNAVLARANQALDEEMDSVKKMNQMIAFAKVQTIRDLQIREKTMIAQEMREDEIAIDCMLEKERVKALKEMQEKEAGRVAAQKEGALVVNLQIEARAAQKRIESEKLAQEREFILKQIEQQRVDEEQIMIEKRIAQSVLMDQVKEINAASLAEKEKRKLIDQLEDHKLVEYQRLRDLNEKKRLEETQIAAAKKEADFAKMRDTQTRNTGYNDHLDALRAKRAIEAAERVARERERNDSEKKIAANAMISQARIVQQAEKQMKLMDQVIQEKLEFDSLAKSQLEEEEREKVKEMQKQNLKNEYVSEIRAQISKNEFKKKLNRTEFIEEGNLIRQSLKNEKRKLEEIKRAKLGLMQKSKVPLKYSMNLLKFEP